MTLPKTVKVEGDDKNHHRPDISMSVFDDIRNEGWLIRIDVESKSKVLFGFEQFITYELMMPEAELAALEAKRRIVEDE